MRNGNDWSDRLPDLSEQASTLPDGVYDGEVCALRPDGSPDFSALRSYLGSRQTGRTAGELTFFAFDLLADRSRDLRPLPLRQRKERLSKAFGQVGGAFRLFDELPGHDGPGLLRAACSLGIEGIVSKRLSSAYQGGERRPDTWLKSKCRPRRKS